MHDCVPDRWRARNQCRRSRPHRVVCSPKEAVRPLVDLHLAATHAPGLPLGSRPAGDARWPPAPISARSAPCRFGAVFSRREIVGIRRRAYRREIDAARSLYASIKDAYPIVLTRDLDQAKVWLRTRARGSERFGLAASSGASRLKPEGITSMRRLTRSIGSYTTNPMCDRLTIWKTQRRSLISKG